MMDAQAYYTPPALARIAWDKFKNKDYVRILDGSAGEGDLLCHKYKDFGELHDRHGTKADACEIDVSRHPILQKRGINVIGTDFLQLQSGAMWSHIVINPPFAQGVHHALKAWDLLWDGEMVAILNAETIKNPHSKERKWLVSLVEKHGSVSYHSDAFMDAETKRTTHVEVAVIHLIKKPDFKDSGFLTDMIAGLSEEKDDVMQQTSDEATASSRELAIPELHIENLVRRFNKAVHLMRLSVTASTHAERAADALGVRMEQYKQENISDRGVASDKEVIKKVNEAYANLKNRAWSNVLHSTNVQAKLTTGAHKQIESQFAAIQKLEFTLPNIYGFLAGLCQSQGELNMTALLDVFDQICAYHTGSDNTAYYKGWKSNDKHLSLGRRIKMTRFILPYFSANHRGGFDWESEKKLADFDKVFAMLDGKTNTALTMVQCAREQASQLCRAERLSASYFEFRFYPRARTLHFYPKRPDLVDRLNRMVGAKRQWIPPNKDAASEDFWKQFERAEKLTDGFLKRLSKKSGGTRNIYFAGEGRHHVNIDQDFVVQQINSALDENLRANNISTEFQITHQPQKAAPLPQLMLMEPSPVSGEPPKKQLKLKYPDLACEHQIAQIKKRLEAGCDPSYLPAERAYMLDRLSSRELEKIVASNDWTNDRRERIKDYLHFMETMETDALQKGIDPAHWKPILWAIIKPVNA